MIRKEKWLREDSDQVMLGAALFLVTEKGMHLDANTAVISSLPWFQELTPQRSTLVMERIDKASKHMSFIWDTIREPLLEMVQLPRESFQNDNL